MSVSNLPPTALSTPITEILLSMKVLIDVNPEAILKILFISILSLGSKTESCSNNCKEKGHTYIKKTKHGHIFKHIHMAAVSVFIFVIRPMMVIGAGQIFALSTSQQKKRRKKEFCPCNRLWRPTVLSC
jgi:hypothetical protein